MGRPSGPGAERPSRGVEERSAARRATTVRLGRLPFLEEVGLVDPLRPTDLALQNEATRRDDVILTARTDKVTAVQVTLCAQPSDWQQRFALRHHRQRGLQATATGGIPHE